MLESQMYNPVRKLFTELGYSVNSEVKDIDITAVKEDELVIIEMKTQFNLKLLIQAAKRQRISTQVYIAIPRPVFKKRYAKEFKDKEYLLRRLELGLIFVTFDCKNPYAQIIFHPSKFNRQKSLQINNNKKKSTLKEINERHGDYNVGGSKGTKLITAYREKALKIAHFLDVNGQMKVSEIRELAGVETANKILYNNHYGWFERVSRGIYKLSEKGRKEIQKYKGIIENLIE